jgi:hypothetical protein
VTLVPLGVGLGWWYGSTYYWPNTYVEVAEPYCAGPTEDGCVLRWQDVQTEEGDTIPQCVKLCPRADVPPPIPQPAVTEQIPPAPVAAAGKCLVDIFAEANFGGQTDETDENQPDLGEWDKAISSVEVKSGTWDFFTEPDFKGDVIRLAPGKYPTLNPNFNKKIGSFLCLDNPGK